MTSLIHIKKTLNAALMLTLFCGVLIVHSAQQYAKAQLAATDPKVTIDIITPENAIKGEQLPIVIRQNIIDKWHTYWMNPGDSGEEMKIKWTLPEGISSEPIQFPTPERIPYGPLTNFGYKGSPQFLTHLNIPADYASDKLNVSAQVRWLVCEEICIPERKDISFSIDLKSKNQAQAVATDETFKNLLKDTKAKLPTSVGWDSNFIETSSPLAKDNKAVALSFAVPNELLNAENKTKITVFPIDYGLIDHAAPLNITSDEELDHHKFTMTFSRSDMPLETFDPYFYALLVLGDDSSYTIKSDPTITANNTEIAPGAPISDNINAYETEISPIKTQSNVKNTIDISMVGSYDATKPALLGTEKWIFNILASILPEGVDPFFVTFLFFAFLGGVILNLMPCVFPVLSLKALSVVKLADYSMLRLWANGLFYTLGILVSFAAIAGALLLFRQAGFNVGWGFQLQNPTIIIILSWLIFAVGLNLSGMFEISFGKLENAGGSLAAQPGLSGAFFTGMLATLVATPCTAAFMGTALGAAVIFPTMQAMSIFLMLGFGLAFPYLLICFIPPLVRLLPRPGAWMETFRQFLAFPMYATAILLVWVAVRQVGDVGLLYALGGMLTVGFGVWLLKHSRDELGDRRPILTLIALAIILLPVLGIALVKKPQAISTEQITSEAQIGTENTASVTTVAFDADELQNLLENTNQPIFVNMTASWCITCLLNENSSLNRDGVKNWMSEHDVIYMKGDWSNYDDHITDYLSSFGRSGVPIYVFYGVPDAQNMRPAPIVLPQILTPSTITDLI